LQKHIKMTFLIDCLFVKNILLGVKYINFQISNEKNMWVFNEEFYNCLKLFMFFQFRNEKCFYFGSFLYLQIKFSLEFANESLQNGSECLKIYILTILKFCGCFSNAKQQSTISSLINLQSVLVICRYKYMSAENWGNQEFPEMPDFSKSLWTSYFNF